MGRFTAALYERFRAWDTTSQISFVSALVLLVIVFMIGNYGPENLHEPATIGTIGLVFTAQAIFMWANRGMVTPYTRAQRLYLKGDLEGARRLLEVEEATGKADIQTLTLLGNTYRQLGLLSESESILSEVVNNTPEHYFSLYGFGRTLLVQGHYAEAGDAIETALAQGASPVVAADAGEARYRQGAFEAAQELLQNALPHIQAEPHRTLMTAYLLSRMGSSEPPSNDLIESGLDYWQAQARLFQDTPYGQALIADIRAMTEGDH